MFEVELRGTVITDIASLYDELNPGFMQSEDWQLGQSLDALDDLLYGGIGDAVGPSPWLERDGRAAAGLDSASP